MARGFVLKPAESLEMLFGTGAVAVVWDDAGEIKCQCGGCALRYPRRHGVEDFGGKMGNTIAREKIGGEEEAEARAVKTHVAVSVAWQVNGAQAVPNVDKVAVVEPAVRNERSKTQKGPADHFEAAGDPGPAAVIRVACIVVGIETRGGNPCSGRPGEGGYIEDVVEVSVREDNPANRLTLPAVAAECAAQEEASSNKSSVEQVQARCIAKDMKIERGCSDLEKIGKQLRVWLL